MELRKLITEIKDILYSGNEYLVHLYEMAQPEGKVRDRIRDLSVPIFEYLTSTQKKSGAFRQSNEF